MLEPDDAVDEDQRRRGGGHRENDGRRFRPPRLVEVVKEIVEDALDSMW